jgi:TolB-like protein/Tfp pilus assembly protein PilF
MTDLRDQLQSALGAAYTLERELGGGGMSRVFVAVEQALGRRVVVKVLAPELAAGISADRFKREIQLAAQLQHPQIVPVLAAGEAAGMPFYTMPFVEGESLRTRLRRDGPLPVRDAVRVLSDVAKALEYAHERGIVHRDIKPDNVLIARSSAAVTDFGIAKALAASKMQGPTQVPGGTLTQIGTSLGTPTYMAPEQAAGDPNTDHRADIYALGCMAYELLAGQPPFHGLSPHQLFAAHIAERPAPLAARQPNVPPPLATLVMWCLEKDPAMRPQTAGEVLDALESVGTASGATATAPTGGDVESGRRRRRTAALALGGVALAAALGIGIWASTAPQRHYTGSSTASPTSKSIAVLPLANVGGDTASEYFAEGMTDELATALGKVPGLRVASRTAAYSFKGRSATPDEIGRTLHVSTFLEGSVRRAGRRLRLSARLMNVSDGLTLWGETYEREVDDVFQVQDDITRAIVGALQIQLGAATVGGSKSRGTTNLEAYDLYLRGRYFVNKRGEASLREAIPLFGQAIDRDPAFARAYAGLGDAYGLLPLWSNTPIDSAAPLALRAIDRAITIDSTLAEAHASRGSVLQLLWRWDEAQQSLRRAIALDPEYATAHQWLGEALILQGRVAESAAALRRSIELDPVSPIKWASYSFVLALAGRHDEARAAYQRSTQLDSALVLTRYFAAWNALSAGRPTDALREAKLIEPLGDRYPPVFGVLGYCYARTGDRNAAEILRARLEETTRRRRGYAAAVGMVYLGLGDNANALTWLERSAREREAFFGSTSLAASIFDPLRAEPRFAALVRTINLDPGILASPRGGRPR